MKFSKNLCYILILFSILCLGGSFYVYAEKNTNYSIDEVQIQCLFETEQSILSTYSVSVNTEDLMFDLTNDLRSDADNEISDIMVISENLKNESHSEEVVLSDISETIVSTVEEMMVLGASHLTFSILEEEIMSGNRLASREVGFEKVGSAEETTDEKLYRLFGSEASNLRGRVLYYPMGEEEALKYMESFKVTVWDIKDDGTWYQREQLLTSHYALVDSLKCIFSELLELSEEDRVPIKSMGCYHYREGSSAHTCGAAIDINWEENAEMTISGVITCGYFWKPGENIYSIEPDSPFVHTFEKYGWTWGGYWTSKKDYMHFSYIDR